MLKELKKNFKIFFLPLLILPTLSCNVHTFESRVSIEKEVDFKHGFSIQFKIKNFGFKSKANSDAVPLKTFSDVKSYSAFLTTNYNDPFAIGSNPSGDGVITSVNNTIDGNITITFSNIQRGGPYFAVIAAFDDIVGGSNRNNITNLDPSILSIDKKWSRSSNSVTVLPSGALSFSGNTIELQANLDLAGGVPTKVGIQVNIVPGDPANGPLGTFVN